MVDTAISPHYMGLNGYIWWHGVVEDRLDTLLTGRCRVRIHGWNSPNKMRQPTEQLIWAHPQLPLGALDYKPPIEGTIVSGYYLDGEGAQWPIMTGSIPGIPDTPTVPTNGFSDPRTAEQLATAPRPPQAVNYVLNGTGNTITEAPGAQRYPIFLNEPTINRIARHEMINQTIVAQKNNNLATGIPIGTGAITINAGIDISAAFNAGQLISALSPQIGSLLNALGNISICGMSINSLLPNIFLVGGLNVQIPTFVNGEIVMAGLAIMNVLQNGLTLNGLIPPVIDINGCIIAGLPSLGGIKLDGFLPPLPLLPGNLSAGFGIPGLSIGATVHGGLLLGSSGGIPISSAGSWSEPPSPYNSKYPYNSIYASESGHVIEVDDTPGAERLHTFHRSGTFQEIHPDGSKVTKVVKNDYHIAMSDHNTNVMGDQSLTVNGVKNDLVAKDHRATVDGAHTTLVKGDDTSTVLGSTTETYAKARIVQLYENETTIIKGIETHGVEQDFNMVILGNRNIIVKGASSLAVVGKCTIMVQGDAEIDVGGNMTTKVLGNMNATVQGSADLNVDGRVTVESGGDTNVTAGGNATIRSGGSTTVDSGGSTTVNSGGGATINAPTVTINSGLVHMSGNLDVSGWGHFHKKF